MFTRLIDIFAASTIFCILLLLPSSRTSGQIATLIDDPSDYGTHPEESELLEKAEEEFAELLSKVNVVRDSAITDYFYAITDRLYPGQRKLTPWKIYLFDDLVPNASAYANGNLYITTGMLMRLDHEAQLAFVLGHELAHFLDRHSLRQRLVADNTNKHFKIQAAKTVMAFSRDAESTADRMALEAFATAGYPRSQASEGLKKLPPETNYAWMFRVFVGKTKDSPYRTHPRTPERIERLEQLAATLDFPENYEGNDYFEYTKGVIRKTRGRLIDQSGNAKKAIQIDSMLSRMDDYELNTPFAWEMKLTQAAALLNLVSLPEGMAAREMNQAHREANYRGQSTEDEEEVNRIRIFADKSNYEEQISAVTTHLRKLIGQLRSYPPMAQEADRLEGSLLYEEENFAGAKPLLQAYLDHPEADYQRRYVRYMLREINAGNGKKKSKKKKRN